MLNDFTGTDKVYIVRGYTYLHKGIDGPAWLTYQQFELDSFTNMLFLFCGRHRGHIKGLYLEKDGIIMLYKRLGQGVVPVDAFVTLPRIRFIPGLTQIRQRLKLLLLPWQMPWNFSAHMQRLEEKLSAFLFQQVCPPLEM